MFNSNLLNGLGQNSLYINSKGEKVEKENAFLIIDIDEDCYYINEGHLGGVFTCGEGQSIDCGDIDDVAPAINCLLSKGWKEQPRVNRDSIYSKYPIMRLYLS